MRTLIFSLIFAALGLAQTTTNGGTTVLGPVDHSGATSTKPVKTGTVSAIPGTCGVGELYFASDAEVNRKLYSCTATNTWAQIAYSQGTAAPGTCSVGQIFFDTDATAGSNIYGCTATNTWTVQGGSYSLPTASAGTLGGVRVGTNLSIDGNGVLSAAAGSGIDPTDSTTLYIVEEFLTGTATSGQIGSHGHRFLAVASGTAGLQSAASSTYVNHPGNFKMTSTTSANSGGVLTLSNTSTGANVNLNDLLNKEWEVSWIARIDSTTDTRARFGISTGVNLAPSTGEITFMIRYDTDAAFADNTKNTTGSWVAQFCGYSSGTCADTAGVYSVFNITPDTNFHRFRIYRSGTTVYFQVDANTAKTMCASGCDMTTPSISSADTFALSPYAAYGISSTTQRTVYIDWAMFKMTGLTRY